MDTLNAFSRQSSTVNRSHQFGCDWATRTGQSHVDFRVFAFDPHIVDQAEIDHRNLHFRIFDFFQSRSNIRFFSH